MPNYCQIELYFNRDDTLELITEFMGDKVMDFNKLIPYPDALAQRDQERGAARTPELQAAFIEKYGSKSDGYNTGGYEWCIENWGTKWNACNPHVEHDHIVFETAWGPPTPVLVELARQFSEHAIYVEFFERGMAFCGGFTLLPKDDWYDEEHEGETWEPGKMCHEWKGEYSGHKGG